MLRMGFFFNDTATTEIYTLSLHDALPISGIVIFGSTAPAHSAPIGPSLRVITLGLPCSPCFDRTCQLGTRSEEHTSELQSRQYLVCRLLLEKKNNRHTSLEEARVFCGS